MGGIVLIVIVAFCLYFMFSPEKRCPVCGKGMVRRNKSNIMLVTDDYYECHKCGYMRDAFKE